MTYAYFYYLPPLHWICKRVHCIPVKKDGKDISALKKALRLLKNGEIIGIFPEGARSETGELAEGEPGVALIALKANVPILPVGIRGAYEAFPKGSKFPKPHPITINFGKPFMITDYMDVHTQESSELQQKITDLIMSKIAEACSSTGTFTQKITASLK
jgi:1-acyl-sn-glycerol-3-phosphate acyltransferase